MAYAEKQSRENMRGRHNAWSRVRVHGVKVPRAEACRRIHSAGAAVRDGHLRDADVSTYDHLMGRDPCGRGQAPSRITKPSPAGAARAMDANARA